MITGTGVDIIEIDRIKKAIDRWGDTFLNHIFNEEEIAYAQTHKNSAQHFAVRFAAKEAIYKAISCDESLRWKDMTILKDTYGKPYCKFKDNKYTNTVHLSLSHCKNYAVANAIISQ
ncbi:MAG: holo-[acyl-carrier protein] synthase [Lysobacterales bacterium]|jgi:holo-[acyl-carrier protein] synthase